MQPIPEFPDPSLSITDLFNKDTAAETKELLDKNGAFFLRNTNVPDKLLYYNFFGWQQASGELARHSYGCNLLPHTDGVPRKTIILYKSKDQIKDTSQPKTGVCEYGFGISAMAEHIGELEDELFRLYNEGNPNVSLFDTFKQVINKNRHNNKDPEADIGLMVTATSRIKQKLKRLSGTDEDRLMMDPLLHFAQVAEYFGEIPAVREYGNRVFETMGDNLKTHSWEPGDSLLISAAYLHCRIGTETEVALTPITRFVLDQRRNL